MQTKILHDCAIGEHVHCNIVSSSSQSSLDEKVWVWSLVCRHVSMTTCLSWDIFKMAAARTRTMVSESFDSFVAPVINKPVPNHLVETSKCIISWSGAIEISFKLLLNGFFCKSNRLLLFAEIYAKVGQNSILQAKPSVINFSGFKVGEKITRTLVSTFKS